MENRFYYTDGTMDETGARTVGIACIVSNRGSDTGRIIHHKGAYYLKMCNGAWIRCETESGFIDHMLHNFDNIEKVYQGRMMEEHEYWELYKRVKKENPD